MTVAPLSPMKNKPNNSAYDKLLQYAFWLLAKKRYTTLEIRKKFQKFCSAKFQVLLHQCPNNTIIDKVILRLTELKYLDDDKYAHDYVEHRIQFKPRGKFMLSMELAKKGIDKSIVNDLWEQVGADETEIAIAALQKRQKSWSGISGPKLRARAWQFLAGKGFKSDAIYRAVESCYTPARE